VQFALGAQVDADAERVFDILLQTDDLKQRGSRRQVDQQVNVTAFVILATRDRPKDPQPACTTSGGQRKNRVALGGQCN
jgi:hypothetical protein